MPKILIFGKAVRCRPVLNYIGAQESLAHLCSQADQMKLRGPRALAAWERDRMAAARKRNAAESKLRDDEREVVRQYNTGTEATRQAIYAMLTDPPQE